MWFKRLSMAGSLILALATFGPSPVNAQAFEDGAVYSEDGFAAAGRGHARRDFSGLPALPPRRAAYRELRAPAPRCEGGDIGSIVGAIAGGLLGSVPADRHNTHPAGSGPRGNRGGTRDCD